MFQQNFQSYPETNINNHIKINFIKAAKSKTKINQRQNLAKNNNNLYTLNNSYKLLIKKIATQLKKRIKLPQCKIFKIYLPYRLLILRIAKRLKSTAIRLNFWEKKENEITLKDVEQYQEIASTACKIIQKKGKKIHKKKNNDVSGKPKYNMTLMRKSEEEQYNKKINDNKKGNKKENKLQKQINDLKNIEINKINMTNFLRKFYTFLFDNNIEISRDNKLPNFKNNENKDLLTLKDFWIKYIIYVSDKYKNELNIFNFLNFIEQFYLWCKPSEDTTDFITEIKTQIYKIFSQEKINNFLSMNKLKNFDQIFDRYKSLNKYNKQEEKFIEIKVDLENCTCPICTQKGCIQKKVSEFNNINNRITFAKKNNLYFPPMSDFIKFDRNKTLYNNGNMNIEYSILSEGKYDDNIMFNYLNKIEKKKSESKKKKKRNTISSNKREKSENSVDAKKNKNENKKNKKNDKKDEEEKDEKKRISAIYDLLGIEGD